MKLPVIYRKKDLQYKESFSNKAHSSICSKRILDFFMFVWEIDSFRLS